VSAFGHGQNARPTGGAGILPNTVFFCVPECDGTLGRKEPLRPLNLTEITEKFQKISDFSVSVVHWVNPPPRNLPPTGNWVLNRIGLSACRHSSAGLSGFLPAQDA
jgi:hypothetical protein